jgi:hypothetical protein
MGRRWGGTVGGRRCGRGAPGTVTRFDRDGDWKDWTRAPGGGDPRWDPKMEAPASLGGRRAVREALSGRDPRTGPGHVREWKRPCILIVPAIHPGTGTGRIG